MYGSPLYNQPSQSFGYENGQKNNAPQGYPNKHPNLIFDFDADYNVVMAGNKIISWTDRVRGITCYAESLLGRPTLTKNWNNISGILFDGANNYLRYKGKISELENQQGITIIFMSTGVQPGCNEFTPKGGFCYQITGNNSSRCIRISQNTTFATSQCTVNVANGVASALICDKLELGTPVTINTIVFDGSLVNADKIQLSINGGGRIIGTTNVGPSKTFKTETFETAELNFGGSSNGNSIVNPAGFGGTICKLMAFNKIIAIGSPELNSIINNIRNEKKLVYAKQIITVGDSRTAASAHPSTSGWADQLQQTLGHGTWLVQNPALDGEKVTDFLTRQSSKILTSIGTYNSQFYCVWGGYNDFAQSGTSAATIFGNLKTYCQNIKNVSSNASIIIFTELPSTTVGWNAVRATLNTSIRNEVSPPWNYICDIGADATIGVDGSESNVTYYSDGTHPTFAGDTVIASLVYNVVKNL